GGPGQRLESERVGMHTPPFPPVGEQEWIERKMRPPERPGDRFEARLLPAAAGLAILEHFVAADDARVVETERLGVRFGPEHEGRVAVRSPGDRDRTVRRLILDESVLRRDAGRIRR